MSAKKQSKDIAAKIVSLREKLTQVVLDMPPIHPDLLITYESRQDILARFNQNFDLLLNDLLGYEFCAFIERIMSKNVIRQEHIEVYENIIENLPPESVIPYHNIGQHISAYIISNFKIMDIEELAFHALLDYITMHKVDFLIITSPICRLVAPEGLLTPPLIEKSCHVLVEHYNIEDVFIYLMCCLTLSRPQKQKLMRLFGRYQKEYRQKRENLHRLMDKKAVCRRWFGVTLNKLKKKWETTNPKAFIRETLKDVITNVESSDFDAAAKINEESPGFLEERLLSLVLLYHNEDILFELYSMIKNEVLLRNCCNYVWRYMHLLRERSKYEKADEIAIHAHTVADARRALKWTKPIIIYLEDHKRYQADFTQGLEHACKQAGVSLPTIFIVHSIKEFKANIERIVEKTKKAAAHICIIDGILEDGYYRDALPEVKRLAAKLEKEDLAAGRNFLCFILTGDVDIARKAFAEVKEEGFRVIDGVYAKPLETYSQGLFQFFIRDGVHGIGSSEQLYQRITALIKRLESTG